LSVPNFSLEPIKSLQIATARRFPVSCAVRMVFAAFERQSDARRNYNKSFDSTYPDIAKSNKTTCHVCHIGDNKKNRNHYGEALRKELKVPKGSDEQKIKEAFKAIEDGECKTGKWKGRLDDGKVSCACGNGGQETSSDIFRQLNRENR